MRTGMCKLSGDSISTFRETALCALLLSCTLLAGCQDRTKAQYISANLSLVSYSQARMRLTAGTEKNFSFPVLEIFNGDGSLVYRNHDELQNGQMLEQVLAGIQARQPLQPPSRLIDILDAVPELKSHEREVLSHHKPVILSVDMEGCGSCRVQARWLDESRERLLTQSIAVLEIHIAAPSYP